MPLDQTGVALGSLIASALNLPPPPTNPSPAQEAVYAAAVAAQLATWTTVAQQILTYLVANTVVQTAVVNTAVVNTATVTTTDTGTVVGTAGPYPVVGTSSGSGTGNTAPTTTNTTTTNPTTIL